MVVREQKVDGIDQPPMHSQWTSTMMSAAGADDEDSSSSSDPQKTSDDTQRKRRVPEEDDDKEVKRKKNREAAKRCRDKKQKQTEDLKHRNGELEKENCQLAKQRDELMRKCREYQREIEQHKQQGCEVPHFHPPYNLDQILQPSSPPSPCFSESAPSTSSCPSPAPSTSPGPPPRYLSPARPDLPLPLQDGRSTEDVNNCFQDVTRGPRSSTVTSDVIPNTVATHAAQVNPEPSQRHYLKVRNKDGSHKILCLDHENYLKVMQRLKTQRAAAAKSRQSQQMLASTSASPATQFQQMSSLQKQPESQGNMNVNTGMNQSPFLPSQEEEREASPKSEQKLDTCEDLLSILKTHVKDNGNGFELVPMNGEEVPVKQEPMDTEYEQNNFLSLDGEAGMTGIKQADVMRPDALGVLATTGQQIRAGLDTLTNPDDPATTAHIQNILKYLQRDEQAAPVTAPVANTIQSAGQTAQQTVTSHTPPAGPAHMTTYVTTSASVGALNKMNAGSDHTPSLPQGNMKQELPSQLIIKLQNGLETTSGHRQRLSNPSMQNVKLRPNAASRVPLPSGILGGKAQSASLDAASTPSPNNAGLDASRMNAVHNGAIGTSSNSMTTETQPQPITNTSLNAGSAFSFQHPPTSTTDTSVLASIQLQGMGPSENLMSESTIQIAEYLKANSIETLDS